MDALQHELPHARQRPAWTRLRRACARAPSPLPAARRPQPPPAQRSRAVKPVHQLRHVLQHEARIGAPPGTSRRIVRARPRVRRASAPRTGRKCPARSARPSISFTGVCRDPAAIGLRDRLVQHGKAVPAPSRRRRARSAPALPARSPAPSFAMTSLKCVSSNSTRDPAQVEALAAREHRYGNPADLRGREDELHMPRRLFQRLEQGVEGLGARACAPRPRYRP